MRPPGRIGPCCRRCPRAWSWRSGCAAQPARTGPGMPSGSRSAPPNRVTARSRTGSLPVTSGDCCEDVEDRVQLDSCRYGCCRSPNHSGLAMASVSPMSIFDLNRGNIPNVSGIHRQVPQTAHLAPAVPTPPPPRAPNHARSWTMREHFTGLAVAANRRLGCCQSHSRRRTGRRLRRRRRPHWRELVLHSHSTG